MNAIEIMVTEHKYITRMLRVVRNACYGVLKGEQLNYDDFYLIIDFIRNYADAHHHKKEEIMLFNRMIEEIGATAEKVVKHGMLVEHDFGRLYISNLDLALQNLKDGNKEAILDVIANAISYTDLLKRHIEKENDVVYKFAERQLKESTLQIVNDECREFENSNVDIPKKYIEILEKLEQKYN
jgi:hemerythrin-like domain-containing protein